MAISLTNCKKTPEIPIGSNKIEIGQTAIDTVSYFEAEVISEMENTGGNEITQHGHCWSIEKEPTIENNKTQLGELNEPKTFASQLTELNNNTKYFVRSYITYQYGTLYGTEESIKTLKTGIPVAAPTEVSNITILSAHFSSKILADSGLTVSIRGFCWDTTKIFTITDCLDTTIVGNGLGVFTSEIASLNEGVEYFVKAYAINEKGIDYGAISSFFTLPLTNPAITTIEVTEITTTSAESGGNVTSDGNGTGNFSAQMTGLSEITTYYITAYATNEKGTVYGQPIEFTTLEELPCGQLTINHGGQIYHTVQIGTQCWLKENLNIGMRINSIEDMQDNQIIEKYCYNNNEANCDAYGGLYQWNEMMDYIVTGYAKGICPDGWHIPYDSEWKILI